MKKALKTHHPIRHAKSFKYAINGVFHAFVNEANFRVQVVFALIIVFMGFYFKISNVEWGLLILSMGFLMSAELINTVVEEFMDMLIPQKNDAVKIIKDLSAGFVMIAAFTTILIFLLIFRDVILSLF